MFPSRTLLFLAAPVLLGACSRLPGRRSEPAPSPAPAGAVQDAAPPNAFVRSTAESRNTKTLAVREGMTKAQLFRAVVDVLNAKHTVEVRDQSAGFAMTSWEAGSTRDGIPDLRYRTRVIVDFVGDDWKQVAVRAEAQWRPSGEEWTVGFDQVVLAEVAQDLQAKIGKPVSAR